MAYLGLLRGLARRTHSPGTNGHRIYCHRQAHQEPQFELVRTQVCAGVKTLTELWIRIKKIFQSQRITFNTLLSRSLSIMFQLKGSPSSLLFLGKRATVETLMELYDQCKVVLPEGKRRATIRDFRRS